jgi:pyruvate/2-oxoglutarate dehydrogenase complex dihydrolipoamide dehydrogenase (E3) component
MAQPERFETLILGSGAGGKLLAWHMPQSGRRTAVVERRWIGGSCPNIACLPTKNEIWSAKVAHLARHAAEFGTVTGPGAIDMAVVRQRKRDMVDAQVAAHLENYKTSGAELILGSARFVAPKTLEVRLNEGGTHVLAGDQVFLNVGTHAAIPSIPGLGAARPLTHIEALDLDYLPPHLIVLGGGYVGLELAQAYRRFGSRVTIVQHGPQLMSREDPDVAHEVQRILSDEGIQVLLAAETLHVHGRSGEKVSLACARPPVSKTSRAATSWSRPGAFRTPLGSDSRMPALSWTGAATFALTTGWSLAPLSTTLRDDNDWPTACSIYHSKSGLLRAFIPADFQA